MKTNQLVPSAITGVLFKLDGVLFDTQKCHAQSEASPLCDLEMLFYELEKGKVSFGIGTPFSREWAWKLIELHCPVRFFNPFNVVCGDQIKVGKLDMELWPTLANQISDDKPPKHWLVVEDGIVGAQSALSAGMNCGLLLPKTYAGTVEIANVRDVLSIVQQPRV